MILWTNLPLIAPFFSPPSVILNQQITIFLYFVVFLSISRNLGGKKGSELLEWWQRQDMHGDVFPGALSGAADFCFFSLAPSLVLVRFGSERSWKHRFLTQRDHNFTGVVDLGILILCKNVPEKHQNTAVFLSISVSFHSEIDPFF